MTVYDYTINGKWAYNKRVEGKRIMTISASLWYNMRRRCKAGENNPTYKGCIMSGLFADFQTFTTWHVNQHNYGKGYHLDKDILVKGNKIYSEEYCVLVPKALNNFLCGMDARRGKFKQGVTSPRLDGTFLAHISIDGESTYIGSYKSEQEAFEAYHLAKKCESERWAARAVKEFGCDSRIYKALMERDWR